MKKISLKEKHLQIYKRENSRIWQIKIKLPYKKAIRVTSGTSILKDAKNISINKYKLLNLENINNMHNNKNYNYKKIHLINSKDLSKKDIECLLDESFKYINFNKRKIKKLKILEGRTIFNLFFEDSTRTRTSFEVAAKRLGADLINVALKDSSINKGETLLDTITTINSMNPDVLIVRHPEEGISEKISKIVKSCVINAGDGSQEHPTQALLDALTIKKRFGSFKNLRIAICGDIMHSRVARSNIEILSKLGSNINIIGPIEWIPNDVKKLKLNIYSSMKEGLKNCDIVMMLRIQKERIVGKIMPNETKYFNQFGLDYKKLAYAKKNAFVMHPGPMNRGVEIDSELADDITRSLIQEQVSMGVAIRMACLEILINNKDVHGI
jgi:aspartate carbamoyltransferase catalytic subunit